MRCSLRHAAPAAPRGVGTGCARSPRCTRGRMPRSVAVSLQPMPAVWSSLRWVRRVGGLLQVRLFEEQAYRAPRRQPPCVPAPVACVTPPRVATWAAQGGHLGGTWHASAAEACMLLALSRALRMGHSEPTRAGAGGHASAAQQQYLQLRDGADAVRVKLPCDTVREGGSVGHAEHAALCGYRCT